LGISALISPREESLREAYWFTSGSSAEPLRVHKRKVKVEVILYVQPPTGAIEQKIE
jgi:hypothetical protein